MNWEKLTPRKSRAEGKRLIQSLMASPEKIEYKKMTPKPEDGDYRIPINRVKVKTTKAALIDFGDIEIWLPLSVIKFGMIDRQKAVDMPSWLAQKHKLI